MQVLKIELKGVTTSFRYPHILVGRQPSYPMPPPATIYGHIASALGDYPTSDSFKFAYTFTHRASIDDYEHTWIIERDNRKPKKGKAPPNITMNMNPTLREMLFEPCMTLYIQTKHLKEWYGAFRSPTFPVLLGRSQDLAAYTKVEIVDLVKSDTGYFEHTLLPFEPWRTRIGLGQSMLMPRLIEPEDRQNITWARYVALTHRVFVPKEGELTSAPQWVRMPPDQCDFWIDPSAAVHKGRQKILTWLSLTGPESEALKDVQP